MQIKETKSQGLLREYSVVFPTKVIEDKIHHELSHIAQEANVPGFRKGKAPQQILLQRFGEHVVQDIVRKCAQEGTTETIKGKKLKLATDPKVDLPTYKKGQDLEYKLSFELMPEIKMFDLAKMSFEQLVAKIEDKEIEKSLKSLAKNVGAFEPIKGKRAAKEGDIAVVDFTMEVEGKPVTGSEAKDFRIELGTGLMPGDFEQQLIGKESGEKVDFTLKLPGDYRSDLAGKEALYKVVIKSLEEKKEAAVDDALAQKMGLKDLKGLKSDILKRLEEQYDQYSFILMKRLILDEFAKKCDFPLPEGMVEDEFKAIWGQLQQQLNVDEDKNKPIEKAEEKKLEVRYRDLAKRRVSLGLLIAKIGQEQKIELSQEAIRKAIMDQASEYPGQEKEVVSYILKNEQALERIKAPLYEDSVIRYVLNVASVKDKKVSVDALMKSVQNVTGSE